jgi:hypothetical protein
MGDTLANEVDDQENDDQSIILGAHCPNGHRPASSFTTANFGHC